MNDADLSEFEEIERLADAYVARLRSGDQPAIEEYVAQYPDRADELRSLLPAAALLERIAVSSRLDAQCGSKGATAIQLPQEFGDFTILRVIGSGGMGIVYEAFQQSLGRHVALKAMSLPALLNAKHLERFHYEAKAAARLQHNHIVPIFAVGELNGLHYYAMQFVQGHSLHDELCALRDYRSGCFEGTNRDGNSAAESPKSSAPFLLGNAKQFDVEYYRIVACIGLQVAEALAYAHSEGVLHRDIKPSNLLVDAQGNIWVTDFGLARIEGHEGLTETGDFLGTLRYMAPERLEGALDRRSDIYSLGATLYELLTLEAFLETKSHLETVDRILNDSPVAPSRINRSVPRDLETIVLKLLSKEPAARYRTAEELAADLRRFLADQPILARRPSTGEQVVRWCRRNRLVAGLVAAVALSLLTAMVILAWSNHRIRQENAGKDQAMASARDAVQQLLTRVASQKLDGIPRGHPLRVELLEDAAKAYEGLLALGDQDWKVREQLAEVLHTAAGLQRDLDRYDEAARNLKKSAAIYLSLVSTDPNPPAIREQLANVESDLAYTWQFDTKSPDRKTFPVEAQFLRALQRYEEIEREWPNRRQPVTLCLRSLADFARQRNDLAFAETLWADAIARGEAYLEAWPTKFQVRNDVCWACIEYYELVLNRSPERAAEAEAMLKKGVSHALEMQRESPNSAQAADVLAALHVRQAILLCNRGHVDEASPVLNQAIAEIHSLCESVPWNADYWNSAQWFHQEAIDRLHAAQRDQDLEKLIAGTTTWLANMKTAVAHHAVAQQKLDQATAAYEKRLKLLGIRAEGLAH